jgi:hypothetical protein
MKKSKYIILPNSFFVLFFLLLSNVFSQPALQWASIYDDSLHKNNLLANSSLDSAGNIFICCSGLGVMTLKYSTSGQFQWQRVFGSLNSNLISTIATKNGNIYTAGMVPEVYGLKVVKYDESGNVLDSCSNGDTYWVNGFLLDENDNSYYVGTIASGGGTDILLLKYDSTLNLIWQRSFSHTGSDWGLSLALDKNNNIYVSGYLKGTTVDYNSILIKYDSAGNQKWYREYDGPFGMNTKGVKVICDEQNNVILGNFVQDSTLWYHYYIVKYTTNGSLIWERYIVDTGSVSSEIINFKTAKDCNIYVLGISGRVSTGDDYLTTKLDSTGNILWNKLYSSPGYIDDIPYLINIDNAGNSYITGSTVTIKYDSSGNTKWSFDNSINNYSFCGKSILTDKYSNIYLAGDGYGSAGNIDCFLAKYSQPVGIISHNQNITNGFCLYQNYPNPFNPTTNIRYSVSSNVNRQSSNVKIVIYDLLGKEIATLVNEKKKAGEYEISFNGASLPSGVYYYVLYADGVRMVAKKMMLLK